MEAKQRVQLTARV